MLRNPELTGGGVKPNPTRRRASERGRERTSEAANERLPSLPYFLLLFHVPRENQFQRRDFGRSLSLGSEI